MTKQEIRNLFYGSDARAKHFAYLLITLDAFLFSLLILQALYPDNRTITALEIGFGVVYLSEIAVRLWVAPRKWNYLLNFYTITDLIVVGSLLASSLIGNLAILRILRSLRVLRAYRSLTRLTEAAPPALYYRDIAFATLNLLVFVFIMSTIVYLEEGPVNPQINTFVDALYFSVTSLTTTGYGDITASTTSGRILAILIMLFGVTLFLRLATSIFHPRKRTYTCPDCGLTRHDADATHCKHCGRVVHIETTGEL